MCFQAGGVFFQVVGVVEYQEFHAGLHAGQQWHGGMGEDGIGEGGAVIHIVVYDIPLAFYSLLGFVLSDIEVVGAPFSVVDIGIARQHHHGYVAASDVADSRGGTAFRP